MPPPTPTPTTNPRIGPPRPKRHSTRSALHLLALPNELLLQILTHLFDGTYLTVTPAITPDHDIDTTTAAAAAAPCVVVTSTPPVKPLLLTCRALNCLTRYLVTGGKGVVRGVVWDFDSPPSRTGSGVGREVGWGRGMGTGMGMQVGDLRGLEKIRALLPRRVLRGAREVEVCVPPRKNLCGGCLCRWVSSLLYWEGDRIEEGRDEERKEQPMKMLEQVLLRVGVRKVGVGEWARLADGLGKGRRDVLVEVLGPWVALAMLRTGSNGAPRNLQRVVRVLVEVPLLCDVRMACRQGHNCGVDCFKENFLYCVIDVGSMKVVEFKTQRCARTIAAQKLHTAHVAYMAAKQAQNKTFDLDVCCPRLIQT